ncbi:MAG: DinB family protein [Chloroflexi bacterium]|nr:DinB family protein [Chloroflexota bacterium]
MTSDERRQKIESYGRAYETLSEALKQFPREMWHCQPAEGWSIHEIVMHIADSEANSFVRCRRLIAEPGSPVLGYDENQWAKALRYDTQSAGDALELFKWLRRASYNLIKAQPDSVASHVIHHSENGPMTFDDWLDAYERHIPEHVAQMQRGYTEWKAKQ